MIHELSASDPRFRTLTFRSGLNLLLAERHETATDADTRNSVGKSSFILLLHFLLGGNVPPASLFRATELREWTFALDFDLGATRTRVERSGAKPSAIVVSPPPEPDDRLFGSETLNAGRWLAVLKRTWFGLEHDEGPSGRSMASYFLRRVEDGGFHAPFKHTYQQTASDSQAAVSFLLDLDWTFANRWEGVRKQEKNLETLNQALRDGRLGAYSLGSVAQLRTEVALAEERVDRLRSNIQQFRVVESFTELERESNVITASIRRLSDEMTMDRVLIEQLETTYQFENPPEAEELSAMYDAVGVQLGEVIRRRFDEVAAFHESIVQNRAQHLHGEIEQARRRINERESQRRALDARRGVVLAVLQDGGALSQLTGMQEEVARAQTRLEELRGSYELASQLDAGKAGARRARQDLLVDLQQDQAEREPQLRELIRRFEEFSARLYDERVGSLEIGASDNGPTFSVAIEGRHSVGIKNMQVFCFDLLIAEVCARRGLGPGFLVHDSHLFDGVDERQKGRGLALAKEVAEESGFQYIVTMNSDDLPSTVPARFSTDDYVMDVVLTDAVDEGGLFGIRF